MILIDARYGGLGDTLEDLYQAGTITEQELDSVMLDLVVREAARIIKELESNEQGNKKSLVKWLSNKIKVLVSCITIRMVCYMRPSSLIQ